MSRSMVVIIDVNDERAESVLQDFRKLARHYCDYDEQSSTILPLTLKECRDESRPYIGLRLFYRIETGTYGVGYLSRPKKSEIKRIYCGYWMMGSKYEEPVVYDIDSYMQYIMGMSSYMVKPCMPAPDDLVAIL